MTTPKDRFAKFLSRLGVSADFLTWLGLFFAFVSGALICLGNFFWAGAVLLLSGLCDLLDGAVARASGKVSVFGGILDSTLDRYGDGFVLGALVVSAAYYQRSFFIIGFAISALLGSFAISYVRARAECEMDSCRVGFWERGERLVFLALGLLAKNIFPVLLILGIGVHWTIFQRLRLAFRSASSGNVSGVPQKPSGGRLAIPYLAKVTVLVLIALFFRR